MNYIRKINYTIYKIIFNLAPLFKNKKIKSKKDNGISLCVRINSENYIEILDRQFDFISKHVQEIIIHFNSIKNKNKLFELKKNNRNIIFFEYDKDLDFVKYTNDFIDHSNYKWIMMFDSDIIMNPKKFKLICDNILSSKENTIHYYSGINIFYENKIKYSNLNNTSWYMRPFTGIGDFFALCPEYYGDKFSLMKYTKSFEKISKPLKYCFTDSFNYSFDGKFSYKRIYGLSFIHLSFLNLENKFNESLEDNIDFLSISKNLKDLNISNWSRYFYQKILSDKDSDFFDWVQKEKTFILKWINKNGIENI